MSTETQKFILDSLDEHLSSDALIKDFTIAKPEGYEFDRDQLNLLALISVVSGINSDFPNDKLYRYGSKRFTAAQKIYLGNNFDFGGVSRSATYLLDLASQGVIGIEFDEGDVNTINENIGGGLRIDIRITQADNNDEEKIPPMSIIHFPSNFQEIMSSTNQDEKRLIISAVFAAGYAFDYMDRILLRHPFSYDAGLLQLSQLIESDQETAEKVITNCINVGLGYSRKLAGFYETMQKVPDLID